MFLLNCLLQSRSAESSSSHWINQVSNSSSGVWSCPQSKERTDQKSFLLLPLPAERQQQLETRIYLAPNHSPGHRPFQSQTNHSRDSRLREGSSSPRFGKDGLCCASLQLAEAQVWPVPSYLLTVKSQKKGEKILQPAVNLFAQGLSCS